MSDVLSNLAVRARALAADAFRNPAVPCRRRAHGGAESCLEHERRRLKKDGVEPSLADLEHARLCPACAAYWHLELAAQALENERRLAARRAAVADARPRERDCGPDGETLIDLVEEGDAD